MFKVKAPSLKRQTRSLQGVSYTCGMHGSALKKSSVGSSVKCLRFEMQGLESGFKGLSRYSSRCSNIYKYIQ